MQEMDPTYEYGEAVDADVPPSLSTHALRRLLYVALAALVILLLVLLPPLISVNRYQKRIANSISASLGRPMFVYWSFETPADQINKQTIGERLGFMGHILIHIFDETRWKRTFHLVK